MADNGANLGFESTLWQAADALRSNMDAAEYEHTIPGLRPARTFAALRDALLPKLISGEFRVTAARCGRPPARCKSCCCAIG